MLYAPRDMMRSDQNSSQNDLHANDIENNGSANQRRRLGGYGRQSMRITTAFYTYNQLSCVPRVSMNVPSFDTYPVDPALRAALLECLMFLFIRGNRVF